MEIPSALCECAVRVQVEGKEKIAGGGGGGGEGILTNMNVPFLVADVPTN